MKILFIRHGESVDDIEDRYGGWADFDLTKRGKEQIAESAEKISSINEEFEIILSSPLKRAYQTAKVLSKELDVKMEIFEYLMERNLNGILTGMVKTEAKEKYPDLVRKLDNYEYVDGSERVEDMNNRVKTAIKILLTTEFSSLIMVTHGLFLKTFFKEIMGVDVEKVGDGAFALIEATDDSFRMLDQDGIEFEQSV